MVDLRDNANPTPSLSSPRFSVEPRRTITSECLPGPLTLLVHESCGVPGTSCLSVTGDPWTRRYRTCTKEIRREGGLPLPEVREEYPPQELRDSPSPWTIARLGTKPRETQYTVQLTTDVQFCGEKGRSSTTCFRDLSWTSIWTYYSYGCPY